MNVCSSKNKEACVFLEVSVSEVTILSTQIIELNCGGRVDDIKESEHTEELIIYRLRIAMVFSCRKNDSLSF